MTVPLIVLAALSVIGGFVGVPASLGGTNAIEHWLEPIFEHANEKMMAGTHGIEATEYVLMVLSVGVALAGIFLARFWYLHKSAAPEKWSTRFAGLYRVLLNKYFVDESYDALIVNPTVRVSEKLLWRGIDVGVIDWCVNTLATVIGFLSRSLRVVQTGAAQSYALVFVAGVLAILGWLIVK
jgi:NADH-quinone oxidoreductase subunit L